MPIEVNELVIRATVAMPETSAQAATPVNDNEQKLQKILDEFLQKISDKEER